MRFLPNVSLVWGGARKKAKDKISHLLLCRLYDFVSGFDLLVSFPPFLRSLGLHFLRNANHQFCAALRSVGIWLWFEHTFSVQVFLLRHHSRHSTVGIEMFVTLFFFVIYFSFIAVLYYTSVVRFFSFLPRPQLATIFARVWATLSFLWLFFWFWVCCLPDRKRRLKSNKPSIRFGPNGADLETVPFDNNKITQSEHRKLKSNSYRFFECQTVSSSFCFYCFCNANG